MNNPSTRQKFNHPLPVDSLEMLLHRMMNRIRRSLELPEILAGTVAEVRSFLGTDRVKVYRFHPDGSGEVVAESIHQKRLPSLLGQRFPADDIPVQARELFLKARQRSIVDVSAQRIGVSPLDCPETGKAIAIEDIRFRPVDPCHVDYLMAMGVQSSLVVPILHQNENQRDHLWGLLVSHHATPRQITKRELQVVQLVADQVSIAIAQATLLDQTRTRAEQEATINRVSWLLHSMTEMQLQQALEQTVGALKGTGGRLFIAAQDSGQTAQLFTVGEQPGDRLIDDSTVQIGDSTLKVETHPQWQSWLETQVAITDVENVWAIADVLHSGMPSDLALSFQTARICSLLVVRLQYRQQRLGYLSVFRPAIDIETLWARRVDRDDPRQLRPRQSFAAWLELKSDQSQEWKINELQLAQALGKHFAMALHQSGLYQQVNALNASLEKDIQERKQAEIKICALNAELEQRVLERTAELQRTNTELLHEISERERALRERQQARDSLKRLSRQNELILNSAGEGIYGLNLQGKTTFVNPAAARMLGREVEDLVEQWMHPILNHSKPDGTPYRWEDSPIFATLQNGTIQHITEDLFCRQDGSCFPVEYVSTPIREQGKIVGAVVVFKDITDRQLMERMKDEFVSVVSHELRTPLTSIRTALGMLAQGHLDAQPEKRQRMVEIAFSNTNRLVRLINDILDLERIKFGKTVMQKRACNVADLIQQSVDAMRAMAEKAEITLVVSAIAVQVWVDPDRIIQTLTNLLSNAIKFSPSGTTVSVTAEELFADQASTANVMIIAVKDEGQGIPEDKLEAIFDRFEQLDASNAGHQGGTGLGLAICRSIVEQNGGQIWVESTIGEGSTFYFTLPLYRT
ncbi:PAS domain S-box [Leptolyngbyaceae cyanobacterium JSC-12]|nr:PAS domain S-box [Leptolyngbyaceae cyanobacterium JSC-12]